MDYVIVYWVWYFEVSLVFLEKDGIDVCDIFEILEDFIEFYYINLVIYFFVL